MTMIAEYEMRRLRSFQTGHLRRKKRKVAIGKKSMTPTQVFQCGMALHTSLLLLLQHHGSGVWRKTGECFKNNEWNIAIVGFHCIAFDILIGANNATMHLKHRVISSQRRILKALIVTGIQSRLLFSKRFHLEFPAILHDDRGSSGTTLASNRFNLIHNIQSSSDLSKDNMSVHCRLLNWDFNYFVKGEILWEQCESWMLLQRFNSSAYSPSVQPGSVDSANKELG